jgi:hypothetical protein
MPLKSFSLKQRWRKFRAATSDNQPQTRKHDLGTSIVSLTDHFWPADATVLPHPASHIDPHDDIAMGAIQTSLAVLVTGSSLASKLPFIAPIADLLLQALTMRDVRVDHISSDNALMSIYRK